ncbi:MAG: PQQ-dependent sugar dehydrogenase [Chloroflexi bacterium]|nr:PQQ-dependent sugar dehydrogenase [Chloroflexota bacterium]
MRFRQFASVSLVISAILMTIAVLGGGAQQPAARAQDAPNATPSPTLDPDLPADYRIEKVSDAVWPVAIDWTPDGRLFYTERFSGNLRVINADGTLQPDPVWTFPVATEGERGLLGVAVSPDYDETGYIYVYYTRVPGGGFNVPTNRIVRITEQDGQGADPVVMLDVPLTTNNLWHQGGNIHFGPDGMLYLAIGEYYQPALAQDIDAIPGKINRFQVQGDTLVPAPDNPFPDSATFAYGLRNTFDFDFDPYTDTHLQIFAADNGPDCDDELNLIVAGGNYGWRPGYPCDDANPQSPGQYIYPLWHTTPTEAPTGVAVYTGDMIPQWQGQVFFCMWNTGKMRRAILDATRSYLVGVREVDLQGQTCTLEAQDGPDGALYFTNQNGIFRIVSP